jgi:hypothetical protein
VRIAEGEKKREKLSPAAKGRKNHRTSLGQRKKVESFAGQVLVSGKRLKVSPDRPWPTEIARKFGRTGLGSGKLLESLVAQALVNEQCLHRTKSCLWDANKA